MTQCRSANRKYLVVFTLSSYKPLEISVLICPTLLATTTLNTAVKPSTACTNTLTQWHTKTCTYTYHDSNWSSVVLPQLDSISSLKHNRKKLFTSSVSTLISTASCCEFLFAKVTLSWGLSSKSTNHTTTQFGHLVNQFFTTSTPQTVVPNMIWQLHDFQISFNFFARLTREHCRYHRGTWGYLGTPDAPGDTRGNWGHQRHLGTPGAPGDTRGTWGHQRDLVTEYDSLSLNPYFLEKIFCFLYYPGHEHQESSMH